MFLHGIFPPITTPFYPDGKIYHRKLEQNVEHYSRGPVAGIVVLGSTGEAILLSDDERREALKTAIDAAANEKVMIAGAGKMSELAARHLAELLRQEPLIRSSLDRLKASAPASQRSQQAPEPQHRGPLHLR